MEEEEGRGPLEMRTDGAKPSDQQVRFGQIIDSWVPISFWQKKNLYLKIRSSTKAIFGRFSIKRFEARKIVIMRAQIAEDRGKKNKNILMLKTVPKNIPSSPPFKNISLSQDVHWSREFVVCFP